MNILIKLTCLIGLVIAPILGGADLPVANLEVLEVTEMVPLVPVTAIVSKEVRIESTKEVDGKVKTIVTTTEGSKVSTKIFEGTEAEVEAQLVDYRK